MQLDWQCPYPSNRSPVFAQNCVATSQPLATQAGIEALRLGGNAVDAAIASAICLTVVEPNNNGIGSDAFAIVWDGRSLQGLNASGRSPQAWTPEYFKRRSSMPNLGWDAVTVPGAVSAWVALSERYGKLAFDALFKAAIHYAEHGFQVGPKTGFYWKLAERQYQKFEHFGQTFLRDGKAPAIGSFMRLPDHAKTLAEIASSKGESFYRGRLANLIAADAKRSGAVFAASDLAKHEATWVDTLAQPFFETELHEIPPNGQGLMALIALGICQYLELDQFDVDDAQSIHRQIEATRMAYADVATHLADIQFMKVDPKELIQPDYLARRAEAVDFSRANPSPTSLGAGEDTVYLTTADAQGMMVSLIQSNYRGFGSGIVVPNTGISLQNRGNGFVLTPGHPNQVGGGKRPFHTIIPGFVMRGGLPVMSFGVMGGHMQAQGHLQMMVRIMLHRQNPQAASDAPRWHLREDGVVCLEAGFDPKVIDVLRNLGHDLELDQPEHIYGGAQLIVKLDGGYCAGSDHRKEGMAAGY